MTRRLGLVLWALLWLVTSTASAQYSPDQLRELQPVVLSAGEDVRSAYPSAWRNAHNAGEPAGSEFVRRWALALRARGIVACVNGKRGSDTLSQDVLVFPVTSGGNTDTSGQYAQIAIVDVIGNAGAANASLGWNDVSVFAAGRCIAPALASGESGGTGQPPPDKPPPVVTPPPATVDLGPVLAKLSAIEARLIRIEAMEPVSPDLGLLNTYIESMVGNGPGNDEPNHVTDLKERIDKTRADVAALFAWLRSRRALGF